MKFNMKALAVAAAMVAAGSAHADLVGANIGATGSSVALVAWNSVTNAYYVRDLGYTLNTFLPNGTVVTDTLSTGIQADKTPEAGLTIDKTNNASFADTAFSSWLAGQTASDVRWTVTAGDSLTGNATNGQARILLSVTGTTTTSPVSNGAVRTAATVVTGLAGQNNPFGLSATGASVLPAFYGGNTILQTATSGLLDVASTLYYYVTTTLTGSTATTANAVAFGNSAGLATLTLASNGDLSYVLAPAAVSAVPVPAAAWLMGTGLMGLGGFIRRRRAAAQA